MHRSLTNFGLSACLAVLLFTANCLADQDQGPSCDDLPTLPPTEDRCAFVKAHCNDEGLLPLLTVYFCHLCPHGKILAALSLTCSAALLIVLFKCMGHAADEYFSSILSQISQDMGLPPRLGGVTLLALGNGAPDLSSSIAAVRSGNYPLALGALTGGSMFVGCVVAGRIVTLSGGVRSRGAQIRDVLTQFLAIATVSVIISTGQVTYGAIAALLSLYVVYVIIVAVADFTKRAGVDWGDIGVRLSKHVSMRIRQHGLIVPLLSNQSGGVGGDNTNNGYLDTEEESMGLGEVESEVPEDVLPTITQVPSAPPTTTLAGNYTLGHSVSNVSRVSNASEVELTISPPISRPRSPVRSVQSLPAPFDAPADSTSGVGDATSHPTRRSQTLGYDELVHMPAKEYRQRALADMAAATSYYSGRRYGVRSAVGEEVAELEALDESEEEEEAIRDEERGDYTPPEIPPLAPDGETQQQNLAQPPPPPLAPPPAMADGTEFNKFDQHLAALGQTLESASRPVMFLLKSTIPIVEMTSYDKYWFLISMAASPLFICLYLGAFSFKNFAIAVISGALASFLCAVCTKNLNENEAPVWDIGSGYPIGAGVIAFYGFAVAAMWIDIFASQIVGILHFFGILAGVHPAVLGVTVLSWGNSLTDFVANTSLAGRSAGGTSMAMTACFAGPLFNMLVGLGVGFWAYLVDTKQKSTPVKFDSVVLVGCVFAMLNCAGVVAVAVKKKHRLPGTFGWVMCGCRGEKSETITGLVFEPMKAVQMQLKEQAERGGLNDPSSSLVRMHYSSKAEAAINEQINVEYNISYVYHSMSAYFDRDNVALAGFAKYFRDQSLEERSHAQKLIDFQNTRGGRVRLLALVPPETEFTEDSRGDALYAMELSLSLERLNYDKLLHLWEVMEAEADAEASHFIEYMLEKQAKDIKETADYVSQLRRVGKGHGVWNFDHELYEKEVRYMAYAGNDGTRKVEASQLLGVF